MAFPDPIGYQLVIVTFIFGFVALSTLIVRIWFRVRQRKFDTSDTCLIAAMMCAILQSLIQLMLVLEFKYGRAKADIPINLRDSLWPAKLAYINQILFKLTTPLSKLSLCLLYRSMCSTSTNTVIKITRVAIWFTIVLIIGAYGSAFLISIFQCTPIRKIWEKKVKGTCVDLTAFRMRLCKIVANSTAVFNLITSAMVITLPIPTLIKLKRHRPEIKQLLGLILLGLIHTGLTIVRFVIMFYPDRLTSTQPQYTHIMPNCLAVAEMDIGIWVATLVVMRPAFQALRGVLQPGYKPRGPSALYYERYGNAKSAGSYRLKELSARSRKGEDEFHILETTEVRVESEEITSERNMSRNHYVYGDMNEESSVGSATRHVSVVGPPGRV